MPTHTAPAALLLTDLRLVDGTGRPPRERWELLVEDGRITRSVPAGTVLAGTATDVSSASPDPDRLVVRRLDGATVLPGLIDTHVHLTTVPGGSAANMVTDHPTLRTLRSARYLAATLQAGVTLVRDLSGADEGTRQAVEQGFVEGPDLQVALRILSITGGHGDWRSVGGADLSGGSRGGRVADGPEDFVRAVREVVREGGDWIKVAASGGMGSPRSSPDDGGLTLAELRAVVDEAARHGLVGVAAHAQGTRSVADAVRAGVRSIEHGYGVDDATIDAMLAAGTYLVPTLSTLTRPVVDVPGSPWIAEKRRRWQDVAGERLRVAIAAGVPTVMGTDAGIVPHGSNLSELALLVEFGLDAMGAVVAATRTSAEMLGVADDRGTLEPGRRADLLAVAHDPLTDLSRLADPALGRLVLSAGRVVRDDLETRGNLADARPL